jgi:hypothetical protein
MIQAKDLRIGNWVKCGGFKRLYGEFKVAEIYPDQITIEQKPYDGFTVEEVEPIPLTPEILEKCGFEKGVSEWYNKNYFTDCMEAAEEMQLQVNLKSFRCGIADLDFGGTNAMTAKPIQHLHQLQNLYFALTGQELTYNQ